MIVLKFFVFLDLYYLYGFGIERCKKQRYDEFVYRNCELLSNKNFYILFDFFLKKIEIK